jgi:hypothetical protein
MRTVYEIEVDLVTETGEAHPAAALLKSTFAGNRSKNATVYRFTEVDELTIFVSFLEQHAVRFQRFYSFSLERGEIGSYPAFYFGAEVVFDLFVRGEVDSEKFGLADVLFDYGTEMLIVAPRMRVLLEPLAPGVAWQQYTGIDGQPYAELKIVGLLPEPLRIPEAVEVAERATPPGTHAVRSDGRDVISEANVSALAALGLARSEEVELPGEKRLTSPRRLVSGRVLDALLSANVKGLVLPPVPLLPATHPALSLRR